MSMIKCPHCNKEFVSKDWLYIHLKYNECCKLNIEGKNDVGIRR